MMGWTKKAIVLFLNTAFIFFQVFSLPLKADEFTEVEKDDKKNGPVKVIDLPLVDRKSSVNFQQNLNYCLEVLDRFVEVLKKPDYKSLDESEKKTVYEVVYLYGLDFCTPYLLESEYLKKFEGLDKISKDRLSVLFHSTIYKGDSFKTEKTGAIKEVSSQCYSSSFKDITSCLLRTNVIPSNIELTSIELSFLPFILKAKFKEKIDVYFFDYSGFGMRGIKVYKDTVKKLKEKGENYLFCWLRFPEGSGKFDKPEDFLEITYHPYGWIECPAFHLEKKMLEFRVKEKLQSQNGEDTEFLILRSQGNFTAISNATLAQALLKKMTGYTRNCVNKKECEKKTQEFLAQINYTSTESILQSLNRITELTVGKDDFCPGKETYIIIKKGWLDYKRISFMNPHQGFEKNCNKIVLDFYGERFFLETRNVINWFMHEFGNRRLL